MKSIADLAREVGLSKTRVKVLLEQGRIVGKDGKPVKVERVGNAFGLPDDARVQEGRAVYGSLVEAATAAASAMPRTRRRPAAPTGLRRAKATARRPGRRRVRGLSSARRRRPRSPSA